MTKFIYWSSLTNVREGSANARNKKSVCWSLFVIKLKEVKRFFLLIENG